MTKKPMIWVYSSSPNLQDEPFHSADYGAFAVPFGASEDDAVEAFRRAWRDWTSGREDQEQTFAARFASADEAGATR